MGTDVTLDVTLSQSGQQSTQGYKTDQMAKERLRASPKLGGRGKFINLWIPPRLKKHHRRGAKKNARGPVKCSLLDVTGLLDP